MIEKIETSRNGFVASSAPNIVLKPSAMANDTLLGNKGEGYSISLFRKISEGVACIIQKIRYYFTRIFCFFRASPSTLDIYNQNVHFISRLSTEFTFQRKQLNRPALKKWWFVQFYNLDPKVQKLLLLEDILLRAPSGPNKREWAETHYRQYYMLATQFVVHLNEETVGGKLNDPIFDVPKLLESLHTYLTIEIERLEKPQE